jgi:hypothetical protein
MNFCDCRIGAAALALALLSGCVSTSVYPDHWAEQVEAEGGTCPDLNGEFVNEGEYFEKVGDGGVIRHTVSLGALACATCTGDERPVAGSLKSLTEVYSRFRLELADQTLAITATTGDEGIEFRQEQPVSGQCSDSLLKVQADWWSSLQEEEGWEMFGYTLGMSLLARSSLKFGRAADGSLLVRQSLLSSLMVLEWPVFPMVGADWIRFPAASPRQEPDPAPAAPSEQPELQAGIRP